MLKIAEVFTSVQGEGYWAGTPMMFFRLSQCPVGGLGGICKLWDDTQFVCDTGASFKKPEGSPEWHSYNEVNQTLSEEQVVKMIDNANIDHVCLTGGEPLIQHIGYLLIAAKYLTHVMFHIETSGTVELPFTPSRQTWVTLSPKQGWRKDVAKDANEIKLVVHINTKPGEIALWKAIAGDKPLFLQALDNEDAAENLQHATKLVIETNTRLSIQTHKLLGVR